MSRAQSKKIKNCSVKLQWRGPLDSWLIGSSTYKLQETNWLSKGENPLFCAYIAVESNSAPSALSYCVLLWSQTQHLLC